MTRFCRSTAAFLAATLIGSMTAVAQPAQQPQPAATTSPPAPAAAAPAPLVVYFKTGSSVLRKEDKTILDQASRAYNEGRPIVMILTGTSDRVGDPQSNLTLSQRRATAVLSALLDRGIPAERFQILAKGESEIAGSSKPRVADLKDRRVEITWR